MGTIRKVYNNVFSLAACYFSGTICHMVDFSFGNKKCIIVSDC